jgi:pyrophosphatase PpaX
MNTLIVFDMDDTLVDTRDLIATSFEHAVREYQKLKLAENEVAIISGYTLSRLLSRRVPSHYLEKSLERFHWYFTNHFDTTAKLYPNIKESLTSLRRKGSNLAVLTGANRRWTEITLHHSGLSSFFSVVMTSDEVHQPKPDPEGLITIMKILQATPEHTTYVGDEVKDIEVSRNARIRAAGALWGSRERKQLISAAPDVILKEPLDLLKILT